MMWFWIIYLLARILALNTSLAYSAQSPIPCRVGVSSPKKLAATLAVSINKELEPTRPPPLPIPMQSNDSKNAPCFRAIVN